MATKTLSMIVSGNRMQAKMKTMVTITGSIILGLIVLQGDSQTVDVDQYTQAQLATRALSLKSKAQSSGGVAGETLRKFPNHSTMLTYRDRNGEAELHELFSDVFYVVDGHATLLTGGKIEERKVASPGEVRGKSVKDGNQRELSKGDIVHISANVPHQLLIPPGGGFTYFVVKVQERPQ